MVTAPVRIAVVGDYQPDHETHPATTDAIAHAGAQLGLPVEVTWIGTDVIHGRADRLGAFDGVWVAPGSPYRSLEGALQAITRARTTDLPLLGTCAGFQHLVIEYARNVMGVAGAGHAEYGDSDGPLFVTALSCSLAGETFSVELAIGSRAHRAYDARTATERYYCKFGVNPEYQERLESAGLVVTGTDETGEARILELTGHRYFVGTLFVPQVGSAPGRAHPLVVAFVREAARTPAYGLAAFGGR